MLTRDKDTYQGICNRCGKETPEFDYWADAVYYMADNGWSLRWNNNTGETEHFCPDCKRTGRDSSSRHEL